MSSILNWCAVSTSKISDKSNNFLLNHSYFFWGLISIGTPTQCSTWSQIAKISWQDHVRNTDCFLVGVRVRVLKISTRVGLEYTAGLEYYITVFQCVQLWFIDWLIDVSCIGLNCWVANFLIKRFFLYRYLAFIEFDTPFWQFQLLSQLPVQKVLVQPIAYTSVVRRTECAPWPAPDQWRSLY